MDETEIGKRIQELEINKSHLINLFLETGIGKRIQELEINKSHLINLFLETVNQELKFTIYRLVVEKLDEWTEYMLCPAFVQLNMEAYQAYCAFNRCNFGSMGYFPDTICELPVILDRNSETLIKIIGSARTEFIRADEIEKIR